MGRGRGKGRRHTVRVSHGNGEEDKGPAMRRRRRPQKQLKDDIEEEEAEKKDEDVEIISSKDVKNQTAMENGRKRKRLAQVKESIDSVKEESAVEVKVSKEDTRKSLGFRQLGSRRKNKPRRAAHAGVECN